MRMYLHACSISYTGRFVFELKRMKSISNSNVFFVANVPTMYVLQNHNQSSLSTAQGVKFAPSLQEKLTSRAFSDADCAVLV